MCSAVALLQSTMYVSAVFLLFFGCVAYALSASRCLRKEGSAGSAHRTQHEEETEAVEEREAEERNRKTNTKTV